MMKNYLLTVNQTGRADENAIASGIPADQLMEAAGTCVFTEISNSGSVTITPNSSKFNSIFSS
jgi:NAD(P)H-hydrate repair Nnr-like enzyme with NAD(P)H-hydrate epimerase domain